MDTINDILYAPIIPAEPPAPPPDELAEVFEPVPQEDMPVITPYRIIGWDNGWHDSFSVLHLVSVAPPRYRMIAQAFLGNLLHQPGAEIVWGGIPNMAMVPLNETARQAYAAFVQSSK